ncbi:MAG: CBS domain-containing protein [Desulfobacterales bacterium]|nr:CBS domain-containing protein [Desulfobacterales bacterium]
MLTAKDIMTPDPITVSPDMPVRKLADLLWKNRISGAPVVDADNTLLGVVTESDLIDQTKKVHIPTMISFLDSVILLESQKKMKKELTKMAGSQVRDICSQELVSVGDNTPLDEIATIMAEKNIHTLPVVADSHLVGVIGKSDIIRTLAEGELHD